MLKTRCPLCLIVAAVWACGLSAHAQQPKKPATAPPAANSADAQRKAKILASDRWRKVTDEFQQWLSVQVVYTPKQITQIRTKLNAQIQKMSADELQQFLDQWDAKLKLLLGKDGDEARAWLGQYMSAMADGYRQKFLQRMGLQDITKATAAEVEDAIMRVRLQRGAIQQSQAAFDQTRQQDVQLTLDANAAAQRRMERDDRLPRAAPSAPYQTPYTPPGASYAPPEQRFFVNQYGEIGYSFGF